MMKIIIIVQLKITIKTTKSKNPIVIILKENILSTDLKNLDTTKAITVKTVVITSLSTLNI